MSCRTLTRFLWTAAVVAALGLAARSQAKPPDLPVNTDHTATPQHFPPMPDIWLWRELASQESTPAKPLPRDDAGMVIENPTLPLIAHLPPVQRRQFASM